MPGHRGGGNRWNEEKQNATQRDGARSITTLISKRQHEKIALFSYYITLVRLFSFCVG